VGIVGRLTAIKNHALFLRAAALYKEQHETGEPGRRVCFVVIGDGDLRGALEDQALELGLSDDLVFTGMRRDPEFFYPGLDIVALTSRNEGTPLTLIEAMLNARPVIATAVGGVIDLLGDSGVVPALEDTSYAVCPRGIRVRPNDAAAFADGLAHLIADEALRYEIGEHGREFVTENYSKERLLADIAELYSQLAQTELRSRQTSVYRGRRQRSPAETNDKLKFVGRS